MQGANQQARHNFVAHAEHQHTIKNVVAQGHGCGHGNHIAAKETELHACGALSHAVTHRRHAARHLGCCTQATRLSLDDVGVMLQRCMGGQQVVVGVNNAQVGRTLCDHTKFVLGWQGSKRMRHIGAAQPVGAGFALPGLRHSLQVSAAGVAASALYAGCDGG